MKRLLLTLLASALTFGATFAQGDGAAEETRMTLRAEMLRMINRDRQRVGLAALELDPDASSVADAYCKLQIHNRTRCSASALAIEADCHVRLLLKAAVLLARRNRYLPSAAAPGGLCGALYNV